MSTGWPGWAPIYAQQALHTIHLFPDLSSSSLYPHPICFSSPLFFLPHPLFLFLCHLTPHHQLGHPCPSFHSPRHSSLPWPILSFPQLTLELAGWQVLHGWAGRWRKIPPLFVLQCSQIVGLAIGERRAEGMPSSLSNNR